MLKQTLEIPTLREFIGQPKLLGLLREEVAASKVSGRPLPNCLFFGPGGLGKTSLVQSIAAERQCAIHKLFGSQLTEETVTSAISQCNGAGCDEKGFVIDPKATVPDIIYVNEAHAAKGEILEILHNVAEAQSDGRRIFFAKEPGISERKPAWCPPVTIILDTNFCGKLKKRNGALLNRFGIKWSFEPYHPTEITKILTTYAHKEYKNFTLEPDAARIIGERCLGVPRTAKLLLDRSASKVLALSGSGKNHVKISAHIVSEALNMLGIDELGLEPLARRYLEVLASNRQAKMGVNSIASAVGSDPETIAIDVEPFLMRAGLAMIANGGRQITDRGLQHIGLATANPVKRRLLSNTEI